MVDLGFPSVQPASAVLRMSIALHIDGGRGTRQTTYGSAMRHFFGFIGQVGIVPAVLPAVLGLTGQSSTDHMADIAGYKRDFLSSKTNEWYFDSSI